MGNKKYFFCDLANSQNSLITDSFDMENLRNYILLLRGAAGEKQSYEIAALPMVARNDTYFKIA